MDPFYPGAVKFCLDIKVRQVCGSDGLLEVDTLRLVMTLLIALCIEPLRSVGLDNWFPSMVVSRVVRVGDGGIGSTTRPPSFRINLPRSNRRSTSNSEKDCDEVAVTAISRGIARGVTRKRALVARPIYGAVPSYGGDLWGSPKKVQQQIDHVGPVVLEALPVGCYHRCAGSEIIRRCLIQKACVIDTPSPRIIYSYGELHLFDFDAWA